MPPSLKATAGAIMASNSGAEAVKVRAPTPRRRRPPIMPHRSMRLPGARRAPALTHRRRAGGRALPPDELEGEGGQAGEDRQGHAQARPGLHQEPAGAGRGPEVLYVRRRVRLGLPAARRVRRDGAPAHRAGARGLQRHDLRLRPDRLRQVLHDDGPRRAAGNGAQQPCHSPPLGHHARR